MTPGKSKRLVIFGAGQIAELAWFYFNHDSEYEVAAFCVDAAYRTQAEFHGLPVHSFEEVARLAPPEEADFFVAVSYAKVNRLRAEKYQAAKALGYRIASYVSSRATVFPGFSAGENCFILEDNTIQPFAAVGHNVTLWSGNHIGHHSRVGDHCFVSSHVVISGGVQVGDYSFLGINATIRNGIRIGVRNVIGAGAVIMADTPDDAVFVAEKTPMSKVPSHRLRSI